MFRLNVCTNHANTAANDMRNQYGPMFSTKVMLNIASYNTCGYCARGVPEDDEYDEELNFISMK